LESLFGQSQGVTYKCCILPQSSISRLLSLFTLTLWHWNLLCNFIEVRNKASSMDYFKVINQINHIQWNMWMELRANSLHLVESWCKYTSKNVLRRNQFSPCILAVIIPLLSANILLKCSEKRYIEAVNSYIANIICAIHKLQQESDELAEIITVAVFTPKIYVGRETLHWDSKVWWIADVENGILHSAFNGIAYAKIMQVLWRFTEFTKNDKISEIYL